MDRDRSEVEFARNRKLRRLNFVALLITTALLGARAAVLPEATMTGPAALLLPILLALFASAWCLFDSRMRNKEPISAALLVIFLFFPVGLPAYCIWSRGLRGLFLGLGILALLAVTVLATALALTLVLGLPFPE
jgi:hypothetical protein